MAGPIPNPPGEGENPTRRYKSFRPRQAARGYGLIASVDFNTIRLFNDSPGSHYVVVRTLENWFNADHLLIAYGQGAIGTTAGCVTQTMVPGEAKIAGVILSNGDAAAIVADYITPIPATTPALNRPYPFAVLPPTWHLAVQNQDDAGVALGVNFIWEAIFADELDFIS